MVAIHDFSLGPESRDARDGALHSPLLFSGALTGVTAAGVEIPAQFKVGDRYLLFVTDAALSETLTIYLLGPDLTAADQLQISNEFVVPNLKRLRPLGDNRIEFSFLGDDLWRLTVLGAAEWRNPLNLFGIVTRPKQIGSGKRYLKLERLKSNP